MSNTQLEALRYPVGRYQYEGPYSTHQRAQFIHTLRQLPGRIETLAAQASDTELDTPYRPGGWTVRQVIHHLPDSHTNAYTRCKRALTLEQPQVYGYPEAQWAELPDAVGPIEPSLLWLKGLHHRLAFFLESLDEPNWNRTVLHDEWDRPLSIDLMASLYAWHSRHHLAHIELVLGKD